MRSKWKPPARATPVRVREGLPLAPNEERYVLSEAMASETFGNPWAVRIEGRLDEARLRAAIQTMCDRHEGRRTGYEPGPDGRFTRYVEATARPDVRWLSMVGASAVEVRRTIRAWFFERCDLTPPSLTRFLIIQTGPDEHLLGNYLHHAVNDGETHKAAICEIIDTYAGRAPDGPAVQYSDLWDWDWRGSPAYREGEAFWRDFLGDVEEVGELPADGGDPPGTVAEWTGPARVRLPRELAAAAVQAAEKAGVSEFAFYYAVAQVLLTRLTGAERVCSTFQSGGRRIVPGSEGVHGVFSNGLVLATRVDEAESIAALATRLRGEIRGALAHEAYPYHHVIQATGLRPRFGINWYPDVVFPECPGLRIFQPDMDFGTWEYDFNIRFVRHLASGGVDLIIYFREATISRQRAVAAAEQFARLTAAFAGDVDAPIAAIRSADLAPSGSLPDPSAALHAGGGELIHARFLEHAARAPETLAILHDGARHSYGDLERRSRVLAAGLAAAGVAAGDRVAILAERCPALVWSMLAAARLGAVFVVLDASYPLGRLERLLEISGAKVLLQAGSDAVADAARSLAAARGLPVLDAVAPRDAAGVVLPALDAAAVHQPAYYLFTSGSTGEPKGVACSHAPLAHFVDWQARTYGLCADDRFTLLSGLSHDPVLRDVFTPLSLGATLLVPRQEQIGEPGALGRWLRRSAATVVHATPALGQLITAGARPVRLPRLRRIFWGGDLLTPDVVRDVAALAPRARQVNFYGSTETPQAVAAFDCDADLNRISVPIGRGVEGSQLLVVNPSGGLLGPGEVGEIAVRSAYPSLGYLSGDTIAPFAAPGPAADAAGASVYRTGDRGFILPGGDVFMLGRADDQIKARGHRVELSEVTQALLAHPALRAAQTVSVGAGPNLQIFAFASVRRGARITGEALQVFLATRLPAYMRPRAVRLLGALPLTANGKVDRMALVAMAAADADAPAAVRSPPAEGKAGVLAARWSDLLGLGAIGPQTSFADLGGDSLSYVQVYLATEEVLGVVPAGWHLMSLSELAQSAAPARRVWTTVDSPLLVRAAAIVLVVSGHLHLLRYGGGATTGLMLVSGFMFGKFQLGETFARGSGDLILASLRRLLVPTMLFCLLLFAAKVVTGKHPALSTVLLTSDFVDYASPLRRGNEIYLWFIDCMVQMMAVLWLAAVAWRAVPGLRLGPVRFALAMFALGCVTRFVAPIVFDPQFLTAGVSPLSPLAHLPTTHLSTMMLGALIAVAQTPRNRALMLVCLVAYAALTARFYNPNSALILLAAAGLMILSPRLPLPRPLTAFVLALSGASLFIYLTHPPLNSLLVGLHAPDWPMLHVAVALAAGVVVWIAWIRAASWVARTLRRTPDMESQAVV